MSHSSAHRCFSLAGRVALVTGSSTGLGKATARCLGLAGAKVAVNYAHAEPRAAAAVAELRAAGVTAELFQADVTSEDEIDAMVTAIEGALGPVDIVVVNATPAQPLKAIEDYDWDFYLWICSLTNFGVRLLRGLSRLICFPTSCALCQLRLRKNPKKNLASWVRLGRAVPSLGMYPRLLALLQAGRVRAKSSSKPEKPRRSAPLGLVRTSRSMKTGRPLRKWPGRPLASLQPRRQPVLRVPSQVVLLSV
jgi:hypothetical protein